MYYNLHPNIMPTINGYETILKNENPASLKIRDRR